MDNDKKLLSNYVDIAVSNVDYINSGGCGIFAMLFGNKLESMGYDVDYIVLFRGKNCVKEIKGNNVIKPTDILSCSWTHIILRVNGKYYIDADGVFNRLKQMDNKDNRKRYPLVIDRQLLSEITNIKYIGHWNNMFNRSRGIKKLKGNLKLIN